MTLKEIGRFQFCKDIYIVLECKEKDRFNKVWWNYYLTRKNYGIITHVIGVQEKDSFDSIKGYIKDDMDFYASELHDGACLIDI